MKKILIVLFVVGFVLGLSACGKEVVYVQSDDVVKTPTAEEPTKAELFRQVVEEEYPEARGFSLEEYDDLANSICDAIDSGATLEDFTYEALNGEFDVELFGFIIGAAGTIYCPDLLDSLDVGRYNGTSV